MRLDKMSRGSLPRELPEKLPKIEVNYGQALSILRRLGFQGAASDSTFNEYIKSLRKFGIPFERGEVGLQRRGRANFTYGHLMELALVLTLRVYNAVPDLLLAEIIRHRDELRRFYGTAYSARCSGPGAPMSFKIPKRERIEIRGVYVDLQINFSGGRLTNFGPVKLLSAPTALMAFVERGVAARALLPINLSRLSEQIVIAASRGQAARQSDHLLGAIGR